MTPPDKNNISLLSVSTDRPSHRYAAGEKVSFRITAKQNGTADVKILTDGRRILHLQQLKLQADKPESVQYTADTPGFIRCKVTLGEETAQSTAAIDPEQIRAKLPPRKDFNSFWEKMLAQSKTLPADFKMTPDDSATIKGFDFYRVSVSNIYGKRTHGFLTIPKNVYGPIPLLVTVAGYGPGFNAQSMWARRDFYGVWKAPVCTLCINIHEFEPPDKSEDLKAAYEVFLRENGNRHYYTIGMDRPERSYLCRAIMGCLRLAGEVIAMPCIDREHVVWAGSGQGGDFGIYLASLSDCFTAAVIGVPGYCNTGNPDPAEPPVLGCLPEFRDNTEEQRLFDCIHHAARVQIPVLLTVGYVNDTNFPSAAYPVLRALKGERLVLELTGQSSVNGNTSHMHMIRAWLRSQLNLQGEV